MKKKGFTLVELLAVVSILALLVIIALPNVLGMFNNAKKESFTTELKQIYSVAQQQRIADSMFETKERTYARCDSDECQNSLDLSGRKTLQYYIKFNKAGKVVTFYATDGTYQYNYDGPGLKLEEINEVVQISDLTDDNQLVAITCNSASGGTTGGGSNPSGGQVAVTVYSTVTGDMATDDGYVTFDSGVNATTTDMGNHTIRYQLNATSGSVLHLKAQPSVTRVSFNGWTRDNTNSTYELGTDTDLYITVSADATIYAVFYDPGCFVAGTKITMFDGSKKNIEDVKVGDKVLSYNVDTKEYYVTTVSHTGEEQINHGYYVIKLENGMSVRLTDNHPLLTTDGFKSIKASIYFVELTLDDYLMTIDGPSKIESIEYIYKDFMTVYYIDVEDDEEKKNGKDDDSKDTHLADDIIAHNGIFNMYEANKKIDFKRLDVREPEPYAHQNP